MDLVAKKKPDFDVCNNKSIDQPAHLLSLISAFVYRSLESAITMFETCNISMF